MWSEPRDWWQAADAWVGTASSWLGLAAAVGSAYAAHRLHRRHKRLREFALHTPQPGSFAERIEAHRGCRSTRPTALVVSMLPTGEPIGAQVQAFLEGNDLDMPLEEVCLGRIEGVEGLENLVTLVRRTRACLAAAGTTEVHLFVAGPVQAGTVIGALLDNWIPVKLYHPTGLPPPANYTYWMPLTKG